MKKTFALGVLALSLTSAIGSIAAAASTTSTSTTMTAPAVAEASLLSVLKTLNSQSFTVLKLEREKEGFEAKVITPEGFMQEVKFDQAGNMLPSKHKSPAVSMIAAVELLEKAGYTSISEIKVHHHMFYEVEALDPKDNKKVELKVNAMTGEVKAEHDWL